MKQHIGVEQLSELTDAQREKLREWWKPSLHDLFMCGENASPLTVRKTTYEGSKIYCGVQDVPLRFYIQSKLTHEDYCLDKKDTYRYKSQCLPILSIGQCIELIGSKLSDIDYDIFINNYYVRVMDKGTYGNCELIDALWRAVKEVLQD